MESANGDMGGEYEEAVGNVDEIPRCQRCYGHLKGVQEREKERQGAGKKACSRKGESAGKDGVGEGSGQGRQRQRRGSEQRSWKPTRVSRVALEVWTYWTQST